MRPNIFSCSLPVCILFNLILASTAQPHPFPFWRTGDFSDGDPELERLNNAFVRFAEKVRPAVVHMRVIPKSAYGTNTRGSGFIINPQGYILTAHHVVAGCRSVYQ